MMAWREIMGLRNYTKGPHNPQNSEATGGSESLESSECSCAATTKAIAPEKTASLVSKIEQALRTIGSEAAHGGDLVRAEYRQFFRQRFKGLRAAEDDVHKLNTLLSWMRQPNSKMERAWLSVVIHERADRLGACMLEVGPYKFAVIPYPSNESANQNDPRK